MLFFSSGVIHYRPDHLVVDVDQEITRYYRSLLPKTIYLNTQMYSSHISIVRKETPRHPQFWGKYEGQTVGFYYNNVIRNGTLYYWLDVFSIRFEIIRVELGLTVSSPFIEPPPGFLHCFHTTLGNVKELVQDSGKEESSME